MDSSLKQRLVGAIVLIALAVIFLPMLVKGPAPDSGVSDVSLAIPAEPKPTGDATTRDFSLTEPGATPQGGAVGMPATTPEPTTAEPAQDRPFPTVAAGDYAVSFGSYANTADADKVIAALGEPIVERGLYNYTSAVDGAFAIYTFGIHLSGPKGKGKGDVVMVQGEKGYVIMSASGTEAVLTILTKPNAKLGLVFLDMKRAAEALSKLI